MPESPPGASGAARPRPKRSKAATPHERAARLTPREIEILQLTADGLTPERISATLGISTHTIRTHVQNILTKLGVHSKLEAVTFAIRVGKVSLDGAPEAADRG